MILNSPSNPNGCVYDRKELAAIADLAKIIFIVSDEIYEKWYMMILSTLVCITQ